MTFNYALHFSTKHTYRHINECCGSQKANTHQLLCNASEHGIKGYSLTLGQAWCFEIPENCLHHFSLNIVLNLLPHSSPYGSTLSNLAFILNHVCSARLIAPLQLVGYARATLIQRINPFKCGLLRNWQ